jgi:RNA polymerase sigma factor (sigma-70 family)
MTDQELIARYVRDGSQDALGELVRRHIDMVHSAATQHAGDAALADDITQAVFLLLMRRAKSLHPDTILAGWLYKAAWHVAREMRRQNYRRQHRERETLPMTSVTQPDAAAISGEQRAAIQETIARLPAADRSAIVLHYLEGRPTAEIAIALATSDTAVRTRLTRARERLRTLLRRGGIALSAGALAAVLEASKVQAAPPAVLQKVLSLALGTAPAASVQSLVLGVIQLTARTKMLAACAIVAAIALGLGIAALVMLHDEPPPPTGAAASAVAPLPAASAPAKKIIAIEFAGTADAAPLRQALILKVGDDFSETALRDQERAMIAAASTQLLTLRTESVPGENRLGKGYIIRFIADEKTAIAAARKDAKDLVLAAYRDALEGNEVQFVGRFGSLTAEGTLAPIGDDQKRLLIAVTRGMHAIDALMTAVGEKFGPEARAQLDRQMPTYIDAKAMHESTVMVSDDAQHAMVDMGTTGPGKVPVIRAGTQWYIDVGVLSTMNNGVVLQLEQRLEQIKALTAAVKAGQFQDAAAFQGAIGAALKP